MSGPDSLPEPAGAPALRVSRRRLGNSDVWLAPLTLGTMRLQDSGLDTDGVGDLLCRLDESGVDTLHSSAEYRSFPLFVEALARLRRQRPSWRPSHIVKLAEPSFDEHDFEPARLRARVTGYLDALDTERLDVIQWMIRSDLADTARRARLFTESAGAIGDCFDDLRAEGLIGAVVIFPYASDDIAASVTLPFCDGAALYFSLTEREWLNAVNLMATVGKAAVIIRPFGTGGALEVMAHLIRTVPAAIPWARLGWDSAAAACVGLPLLHPQVTTVIATVSSLAHIDAARPGWQTRPDRPLFQQILAIAGKLIGSLPAAPANQDASESR